MLDFVIVRHRTRTGALAQSVRTVFASLALLLALAVPDAQLALAAAGDLDRGFGTGGKLNTDFGGIESVEDLVIQPDGKLVAAGSTSKVERVDGAIPPIRSFPADFALARYQADGTLDGGFGAAGQVKTDLGGDDQLAALVIQSDGRLVAAGSTRPAEMTEWGTMREGDADFVLVRYTQDGTLDPSFGREGQVVTDLGGSDEIAGLALQPDGKLMAVGRSQLPEGAPGTTPDMTLEWQRTTFALARYNPDGTLDASFGTYGIVITRFTGGGGWASELVILPDGRIIVAGAVRASVTGLPQQTNASLARYTVDGLLDATFGADGILTLDFGRRNSSAYALLLQPDGKLVVAVGDMLIRYNPDDTLDASFGTGGRAAMRFTGALALQADGKLVAAGGTAVSDAAQAPVPALVSTAFAVGRYNADGSIDDSFGSVGVVTTPFSEQGFRSEGANALVIQPDGSIVAAGRATCELNGDLEFDFGLVRFQGS